LDLVLLKLLLETTFTVKVDTLMLEVLELLHTLTLFLFLELLAEEITQVTVQVQMVHTHTALVLRVELNRTPLH
jgi:chromatin remodeling complex protein RSC6